MLCFTIDDKRVINIFENCINNNKYEAICGPIKYYDFSKKDDAWIEDAMKEDRMGIYLIKDIYFQEQKEFRFVICEDDLITKNKPYYRLNLQHSFKNESEIIKVTNLKNKYFKLIT